MATASKSTEEKRKGMNRTRSGATTTSGAGGEQTINIPLKADCIVLENTGTNVMRFVFDPDPFANAFDLPPAGDPLSRVEFAVNGGKDIKVRSTVGTTTFQWILSG